MHEIEYNSSKVVDLQIFITIQILFTEVFQYRQCLKPIKKYLAT